MGLVQVATEENLPGLEVFRFPHCKQKHNLLKVVVAFGC